MRSLNQGISPEIYNVCVGGERQGGGCAATRCGVLLLHLKGGLLLLVWSARACVEACGLLTRYMTSLFNDIEARFLARPSHVLVRRGAQGGPLLADLLGRKGAREDVSAEQQRGVEQRGSPARLRPVLRRPGAVGEVVEVRHEEHHRFSVVQVPELVPPLRQPARVLAVFRAADQAGLKLLSLYAVTAVKERWVGEPCRLSSGLVDGVAATAVARVLQGSGQAERESRSYCCGFGCLMVEHAKRSQRATAVSTCSVCLQ